MNQKDVIIACDFSSAEETLAFLDRFGGRKPYVKIGMELYYAARARIWFAASSSAGTAYSST